MSSRLEVGPSRYHSEQTGQVGPGANQKWQALSEGAAWWLNQAGPGRGVGPRCEFLVERQEHSLWNQPVTCSLPRHTKHTDF